MNRRGDGRPRPRQPARDNRADICMIQRGNENRRVFLAQVGSQARNGAERADRLEIDDPDAFQQLGQELTLGLNQNHINRVSPFAPIRSPGGR